MGGAVPGDEQVRLQLHRVLASRPFADSPRLCQVLSYLTEETLAGRGDKLNEFGIAFDVFGKDSSFDPKQDSIVRVHMGKARSHLEWYYDGPGRADELVIELPKRTYIPSFRLRAAKTVRTRPRWVLVAPILGLCFLGLAVLGFPDSNHTKAEVLFRKGQASAHPETQASYYEEALSLDPNHQPALMALAWVLTERGFRGFEPSAALIERGRGFVKRAITLDDRSARAHMLLADVLFGFDWNWPAAEEEARRAIALEPNLDDARVIYSKFLAHWGRFAEAEEQARAAVEIDRFSAMNQLQFGLVLCLEGRPAEALDPINEALRLDPHSLIAHYWRGRIDLRRQRPLEAIGWFEKAGTLAGTLYPVSGALGAAFVMAGQPERAEELLRTLRQEPGFEMPWFKIAQIQAALGNKRLALESLEGAFRQRAYSMTALRVDPAFDSLREEPGFKELLHRMALD